MIKSFRCKKNHGLSKTPQHIAWVNMVSRCIRPNHKRYADYGGRGIKICDRWMDYLTFLEDMGERPEGMSIERIDNDGDYCPENCKWGTYAEQARNRRQNINILHRGKTQCLRDWAVELNINYQTLYTRYKAGWSVDKMLNIHKKPL